MPLPVCTGLAEITSLTYLGCQSVHITTTMINYRRHNRNLLTFKVWFEKQAHGFSLFTGAALNQKGCPKGNQKLTEGG